MSTERRQHGCLVTGAAGFIGSHLTERLLAEGHRVLGVDCFTDYYGRARKEENLGAALAHPRFTLVEEDLLDADLSSLLTDADYVFHQAAQPGVRPSWGQEFDIYLRNNVLLTQRLLEAAREADLKRFVYASSSSVYGNLSGEMREDGPTRPRSPYGVTKLAGEHLCALYRENFSLPAVCLRYFTVYGPRQRPDMALHRFVAAVLAGKPIQVYGDGKQSRDFTFVADVVEANVLAAFGVLGPPVLNVGGGSRVALMDAVRLIEQVAGRRAEIQFLPVQHGDVDHTAAQTALVHEILGFTPRVGFEEGLEQHIGWVRDRTAHLEVPA